MQHAPQLPRALKSAAEYLALSASLTALLFIAILGLITATAPVLGHSRQAGLEGRQLFLRYEDLMGTSEGTSRDDGAQSRVEKMKAALAQIEQKAPEASGVRRPTIQIRERLSA